MITEDELSWLSDQALDAHAAFMDATVVEGADDPLKAKYQQGRADAFSDVLDYLEDNNATAYK